MLTFNFVCLGGAYTSVFSRNDSLQTVKVLLLLKLRNRQIQQKILIFKVHKFHIISKKWCTESKTYFPSLLTEMVDVHVLE